ncbi:MAG: hypothetical protein PWP63_193 [Methanolobus sp.]|nr:hypothetical protein [Methanolobus sp.]
MNSELQIFNLIVLEYSLQIPFKNKKPFYINAITAFSVVIFTIGPLTDRFIINTDVEMSKISHCGSNQAANGGRLKIFSRRRSGVRIPSPAPYR